MMNGYTGSETWVYTMATELLRMGYDVTVFTRQPGKMSAKLHCDVIVKKTDLFNQKFDLCLCNHRSCFALLPKDLFTIFTGHSYFLPIEQFPVNPSADCSVAVTEEIAEKASKYYKDDIQIIRNGIDCERFKPTKVNDTLQNILYLSSPRYRNGQGEEIVKKACEGYNFKTIPAEVFEIEELIDWSDLVISLGRGLLEGMAAGKNVLSGDWRNGWMTGFKGAGMITLANFNEMKTHAFSGRNNLKTFDAQSLREEFKLYHPERGWHFRQRILREFNAEDTIQEYLDIYRVKHLNQFIN
jgi:glycosyltransferase involved in cell wall biosynthesis